MKTLQEHLNETVGGGSYVNEANDVKLQPGMACLIQYVFKNGFKDIKLTNMIYEPDFNALDPAQCNMMVRFICSGDFGDNLMDIKSKIKKALDKDIKVKNIIIDDTYDQIEIKCSTAKIVPLNAGEHIKAAASFAYFNGHWNTPKELDKEIADFVSKIAGVPVKCLH